MSDRPGNGAHPITLQAHADMLRLSIPRAVYLAYCIQANTARKRGIAWEFTLPDWWAWWQFEDRWSRRGRGAGQLVMARLGDVGAYSPGNTFPATPGQNQASRPAEMREADTARARATREANGKPLGTHLKVRGEGHPRSRAVVTPLGRFGSAALASEAHGWSRSQVACLIRGNRPGFYYEDTPQQVVGAVSPSRKLFRRNVQPRP